MISSLETSRFKAAGVCQTAETTINKSLIEDLLGTFLLVQQVY